MTDDVENKSEATPKRTRTRRQRGRGEDSVYQRNKDKRWIVEIRDGYKPSGKPIVPNDLSERALSTSYRLFATDNNRYVFAIGYSRIPVTARQNVSYTIPITDITYI